MKILAISNFRGTHTARPEAEIFVALAARGVDISIMTYPDAEYISRFRQSGIKVIEHHPSSKYDKEFITTLRQMLKDERYDILHLFNNKAIRNGIAAAKGLTTKVCIYRGASANMQWYNPLNYFKFYHPRIDYVVCNSEEIKQKFVTNPFFKSDRAVTIFKGHDTGWYKDTRTHYIRKELGIDPDALLFVTVANNRKVKGIQILLLALSNLPSEIEAHFLIIGSGMDRSNIKSMADRCAIKSSIHFLGFRQDALNIVASSNVFICPSTGSEALTKSVVEAMSLSVVPIISDIAGNKPLVDHGINGYIFQNKNAEDLASKIVGANARRSDLVALGAAAKEKIEVDLNHETAVERYFDFYSRISKD